MSGDWRATQNCVPLAALPEQQLTWLMVFIRVYRLPHANTRKQPHPSYTPKFVWLSRRSNRRAKSCFNLLLKYHAHTYRNAYNAIQKVACPYNEHYNLYTLSQKLTLKTVTPNPASIKTTHTAAVRLVGVVGLSHLVVGLQVGDCMFCLQTKIEG